MVVRSESGGAQPLANRNSLPVSIPRTGPLLALRVFSGNAIYDQRCRTLQSIAKCVRKMPMRTGTRATFQSQDRVSDRFQSFVVCQNRDLVGVWTDFNANFRCVHIILDASYSRLETTLAVDRRTYFPGPNAADHPEFHEVVRPNDSASRRPPDQLCFQNQIVRSPAPCLYIGIESYPTLSLPGAEM